MGVTVVIIVMEPGSVCRLQPQLQRCSAADFSGAAGEVLIPAVSAVSQGLALHVRCSQPGLSSDNTNTSGVSALTILTPAACPL